MPWKHEDKKPVEPVTAEDKSNLVVALAEHFDVPVESLTGFILAAECGNEKGTSLLSAWSAITPKWTLRGFAIELRNHVERIQ